MLKKICVAVLMFAAFCFADKVYLINGDIVSGNIKTAAGGNLVVASEFFGEVKIDILKVKTFETDEPLPLHLSDGSVLNHKVIASSDGQIATEAEVGSDQTIKLKDIETINPASPQEPRWKGSVKGGLFYSSGNTRKDSYNLGFSFDKDTDKDRTSIKGDTVRSREGNDDGEKETTEDWWKLSAKYDYFLSKKTYVYGNTQYKKDSIAELDRRVIIGGGIGRKFFDKPDLFTLDGEVGLASVYEKYEDQESSSEMSLRAAYNLFKRLNNKLVFIHGLEYYPQMESFSDYYLSSFGELKLDVSSSMFTSYKIIFDYDSTPAEGSVSTDVKHLLSVGLNF